MKFKLALLIALLTVVATVQAQEHEPRPPKTLSAASTHVGFPVRLGDRTIFIPDPEGFEEATSQFASFKRRVETTEAPQNDTLGAHLPLSDCELLRQGLLPTYNLYTKVSVMKIARELDVSAGEMAAIVDDFRKNLTSYLDPNGPAMKQLDKHLEQGLTNLDSKETKIDFNQPQQLGEFDMRIDVRSFLMLMAFTINSGGTEQTQPMLATTSFVRVKDRVIFAYTFMKYKSKADLDTIKQFTTKWTNSIVAANK